MAVFSYTAKDSNQKGIKGSIVSDSPSAARRSLRDAGLTVISMSSIGENLPNRTAVTEKPNDNSVDTRRGFDVRRSPSIWNWGLDPTPFLGDLATLLSVGVPLVEALETLIRQARGRWQDRLLALKESVESGLTLRDAMERQSDIFDELSISLVEMGENTGRLDDSLRRLADFKRRSSEFRDRVFNALMYPGVILVMSVGVSLFLMNFVVPTLLENLADMGKELPWPTKVLKFISDVIVSYGHYMLMFAIAAMFGVVLFLATKTGRRIRDQVVLKLPLVGNMSRKQEISRVCFVVSTLLSSGLDLIRALDIAKRTSKNVLLQESLGLISERVRSGKELQQAMERLSYFPPLVAQVFSVGQKSGKLDELLLQLAEDYDKQVSTLSNRLAVIVEPVLIVILSVIVGFILFATMLPILEAGNVL